MVDKKDEYLVCDVCFNEQIIEDVKLLKTCNLGKIIQGLWEDEKFYGAALRFLKSKEEKQDDSKTEDKEWPLKSIHGLDRSILRAYVAIRVLPNWKWLEFKDFVADFENQKETLTIGDVLGNLSKGVQKPILRIVPKSKMEVDDGEVKTIVQELLTTKSLATLSAAGCPLSKGMMSLIGQDKYACTISYEKRERFIHWLCRQDLNQEMLASPVKSASSPLQLMTPIKIAKSRVTFDPEGEISKLEGWFDKNQRPNKEIITEYTEELNKSRLGKGKRMLLPESIAVWFKNRRAKAKKDESATHDQLDHKMWEVEQQAGNEMPTMVLLHVSMENKEGTNKRVCSQGSDLVDSGTLFTTAETNGEQIMEDIDTVIAQEGTSVDGETSPVLLIPCVQDQNDIKTTANNEADTTDTLINDDKKTSNQQMTTGSQGWENGNRLETGSQSVKTKKEIDNDQVIEHADKTNADHMVVTVSAEKLGCEVKDINDGYAVSFVKSEESDGGSSLKRAREKTDQETKNSLAPEFKQQCL